MLYSDVDLHPACMTMQFAKVSVLRQKHRTMGVVVFCALSRTVTLSLVILVHNTHLSISADYPTALFCQRIQTCITLQSSEGV